MCPCVPRCHAWGVHSAEHRQGHCSCFLPFWKFNQATGDPQPASCRHGCHFPQPLNFPLDSYTFWVFQAFWASVYSHLLLFSWPPTPFRALCGKLAVEERGGGGGHSLLPHVGVWLGRIPLFSYPSGLMSVPVPAGWPCCVGCPCECRRRCVFASSLLNSSCGRSIDLWCI